MGQRDRYRQQSGTETDTDRLNWIERDRQESGTDRSPRQNLGQKQITPDRKRDRQKTNTETEIDTDRLNLIE